MNENKKKNYKTFHRFKKEEGNNRNTRKKKKLIITSTGTVLSFVLSHETATLWRVMELREFPKSFSREVPSI